MIQDPFHRYAQNLLGAMMTLGDEAMVLSQLCEAVSNPEAAHSRRLPQVERSDKTEELKGRLVGVCVERQLDPSHALLDATSQMCEAPVDLPLTRKMHVS